MNKSFFSDKIIVVTGAASGMGRETSILLSRKGAHVMMLDLSEEGLKETLSKMEGDKHKMYTCDLSEIDNLKYIIKDIISENGKIYGLVHCAGITSRKPLNMLKPEGFEKIMKVNVYSFVELVKHITKKGNFINNASIVAISSVSSIKGYKAKSEYCMSKAALDAVIRCLALELAEKQIRINSVMPGIVDTPMAMKSRALTAAIDSNSYDEGQPLGNTKPMEVANLLAYLLSNESNSITGTSIKIDGGLTI